MKQVLVLKADQQMDRRSSSSSFRRDRNNPNLEVQATNTTYTLYNIVQQPKPDHTDHKYNLQYNIVLIQT